MKEDALEWSILIYYHDILKYDVSTHTYYVADRFSPALESKMRSVMTPETLKAYDKFIFANWGRRPPSDEYDGVVDEVAEAVLRYEEEEKKLRLEKGLPEEVEVETASIGDLEIVGESVVEDSETSSLNITMGGETVSEEDLDDAAFFFDFFDGEVDV